METWLAFGVVMLAVALYSFGFAIGYMAGRSVERDIHRRAGYAR